MKKYELRFEYQLEESNINNKVTTIDIESNIINDSNTKEICTLNQEEIYEIFNIIDSSNYTKNTCDGISSYNIKYNSENEEGFINYGVEIYDNEYHITSQTKGEAILKGEPKEKLERIINKYF